MTFSDTLVMLEVITILREVYDELPESVKKEVGWVQDAVVSAAQNEPDLENILTRLRPLAEQLKEAHPRLAKLLK